MSTIVSNTTGFQRMLPCEPRPSSPDSLDRTFAMYRKTLESQYLDTYKALHLGGKETVESRLIRFANNPSAVDEVESIAEVGSSASALDITSFIKARYQVLMVGAGVDPDDLSHVKEFYLCDQHVIPAFKGINSFFINNFATSKDTILIEGVKAGEIIAPEETSMGNRLTTSAVIKGWDIDDGSTFVPAALRDYARKLVEIEKLSQKFILEYQKTPSQEVKRDILARFREVSRECADYFTSSTVQPEDFVDTSRIIQTFPARQESMKNTISSESSTSPGRVFLMAGVFHLWSLTPELNAQDFVDFAKSRNAVILCPLQSSDEEVLEYIQIVNLFMGV